MPAPWGAASRRSPRRPAARSCCSTASKAPQSEARRRIVAQWQKLQEKGKLDAAQREALSARVHAVESVAGARRLRPGDRSGDRRPRDQARSCSASSKRSWRPTATLATNTSSLSVTAIAAAHEASAAHGGIPLLQSGAADEGGRGGRRLQDGCGSLRAAGRLRRADGPQRGAGARTRPASSSTTRGAATAPKRCASSGEGVADFATIDRILKDQAGFRLGPFELLDLTALDVSHPVMESIYRQYYEEPRFRPSVITAQRLAAGAARTQDRRGLLPLCRRRDAAGRRAAGARRSTRLPPVWVSPRAARRPELLGWCMRWAPSLKAAPRPRRAALILVAPLGFDVTTVAAVERLDATRTLGIDLMVDDAATKRRVLATNPATRRDMRDAAHALFARDGKAVSVIRDSGGFVTQRVLATIVNIAADMCQQRVCSPADLDTAVRAGPRLSAGPAGDGRPVRPDQRAGGAVQPPDRVRRPALSPEPLAAPPGRARPEPHRTKRSRAP